MSVKIFIIHIEKIQFDQQYKFDHLRLYLTQDFLSITVENYLKKSNKLE